MKHNLSRIMHILCLTLLLLLVAGVAFAALPPAIEPSDQGRIFSLPPAFDPLSGNASTQLILPDGNVDVNISPSVGVGIYNTDIVTGSGETLTTSSGVIAQLGSSGDVSGVQATLDKSDTTYADILSVLPFGNTIVLNEMQGDDIVAALQEGVSTYPEPAGGFLHISGMALTFDPSKPAGIRIITASVGNNPVINAAQTAGGGVLLYTEGGSFGDSGTYTVATNDILAAGGDGSSLGKGVLYTATGIEEYLRKIGANSEAGGRINPSNFGGETLAVSSDSTFARIDPNSDTGLAEGFYQGFSGAVDVIPGDDFYANINAINMIFPVNTGAGDNPPTVSFGSGNTLTSFSLSFNDENGNTMAGNTLFLRTNENGGNDIVGQVVQMPDGTIIFNGNTKAALVNTNGELSYVGDGTVDLLVFTAGGNANGYRMRFSLSMEKGENGERKYIFGDRLKNISSMTYGGGMAEDTTRTERINWVPGTCPGCGETVYYLEGSDGELKPMYTHDADCGVAGHYDCDGLEHGSVCGEVSVAGDLGGLSDAGDSGDYVVKCPNLGCTLGHVTLEVPNDIDERQEGFYEWAESEAAKAHTAPCGIAGHYACDPSYKASDHAVISIYCDATPPHTKCMEGTQHTCDGCGATYDCEDSNAHTICAGCEALWCSVSNPNWWHTSPCGVYGHQRCKLKEAYVEAEHEFCDFCEKYCCTTVNPNHGKGHCVPADPPTQEEETLYCPNQCGAIVEEISDHLFACGEHYWCKISPAEYEETWYWHNVPCDDGYYLCESASGHLFMEECPVCGNPHRECEEHFDD